MKYLSKKDKVFFLSLIPSSIVLLGILIITVIAISSNSIESLEAFGLNLLASSTWDPENGRYGLLAPVVGSIVTSTLAVLTALILSIPLSILIAEYLRGSIRNIFSSIVELMGGLPTIIYAIWASTYLAPVLKTYIMDPLYRHLSIIPLFSCRPITGFTVFTAGVSIGISIVPYVTAMVLEAYQSIPLIYKEACLGIGATKYESIKIMISLAKPAILASLILGFARSLGETTIAVATIGNSMYLSTCIFSPGYTVSALIASQFANAYLYKYAESVLYLSALVVLFLAILLSFIGLSIIIKWRGKIVV
ncbi:MAG: phosphate ABC transporter permease subunit PstC [Desulfurococcaceae archaeon]